MKNSGRLWDLLRGMRDLQSLMQWLEVANMIRLEGDNKWLNERVDKVLQGIIVAIVERRDHFDTFFWINEGDDPERRANELGCALEGVALHMHGTSSVKAQRGDRHKVVVNLEWRDLVIDAPEVADAIERRMDEIRGSTSDVVRSQEVHEALTQACTHRFGVEFLKQFLAVVTAAKAEVGSPKHLSYKEDVPKGMSTATLEDIREGIGQAMDREVFNDIKVKVLDGQLCVDVWLAD